MERFEEFYLLLTHPAIEGGRSDKETDAGGKTNSGITQKAYDAVVSTGRYAPKSVYDLTDEEKRRFYQNEYYRKVIFVEDKETHYNLFDACVNGGYGAYLEARTALKLVKDPLAQRKAVYASRESRYRMIANSNPKTGAPNLKGWLLRLARIKEYFATGRITQ